MERRDLLKALGTGSVLAALPGVRMGAQMPADTPSDRSVWIGVLRRLADPVLTNTNT